MVARALFGRPLFTNWASLSHHTNFRHRIRVHRGGEPFDASIEFRHDRPDMLGVFFACLPLLTRRAALKMYAQKADRDMTVTWEISNDRVSAKTEVARSDMTWAAFRRVLRLPEGFLLYPNDSISHWLPVNAFAGDADVERFAALAKARVGQYDYVA